MCILAGGLGTRLGSTVADTPKPLLPVAGEPFLMHQLRLLSRHGCQRVVLCVGYLGERIEEEIGYERFGIEILYSYDGPELLGTAGAVRKALPLLGDTFNAMYGDTYLRIDYRAVERAFRESGASALMTVLRNDDKWDKSNVIFADGRVVAYDKESPTAAMHWIDYGLSVMNASALDIAGEGESDLARVFEKLAAAGDLAGFEASERFFEIGTPEALVETEVFLASVKADSARPA